ncbi:MAG: ATP-binding protein [Gemmatimonadota bacterium]|nr:ATP-binding protein [Gemmatimonadota bacterium]
MSRPASIRKQLAGLVVAVAFPLAVLLVYTIVTDFRARLTAAESDALLLVEARAGRIEQYLVNVRQILSTLALDPAIRSPDPAECDAAIQPVHTTLPLYAPILVVDGEGSLRCASISYPEPISVEDRRWYRDAMTTGGFSVGEPVSGRITGRTVIVLGRAVRDEGERVVGVVGIPVDQLRFQEFVDTAGTVPGALMTLADTQGVVLARSDDSDVWVDRSLPRSGVSFTENVVRGSVRTTAGDGEDRVFGFRRISGTPWVLWVGLPTQVVYGDVRGAFYGKLVLAGLALVLVVVLAAFLNRRVNAALSGLVDQMRRAGEGSGEPVSEDAPDEVARVAQQFNRTLEARSRAEGEVAVLAARYKSITDNSVFGIYVCRSDGGIIEANPAMAAMLGAVSTADVLSMNEADLYWTAEDHWRSHAGAGPTGRVRPEEVSWRRLDGSVASVRVFRTLVPLGAGEGQLMEVIAEDLTERRVLEEQFRQAQKMEAMGRLAGGVAHEFNNRLMVIRGHAEILEDRLSADSGLRRSAEAIRESSDRAAALTAQLLAASRKQVARREVVDLAKLVAGMTPMLESVLGERVSVEIRSSGDERPVLADSGQIEQVLMNLLVNAMDAMPQGGTIVVGTARRRVSDDEARRRMDLDPGTYTVLSVRDNGVGMDAHVMDHAFDPFFTTKPKGQGTGLGLAMVYGLLQQHGGCVRLHSAPGEGTEVEVLIPESDPETSLPSPTPSEHGAPVAGSGHVMVVEDEEGVRGIVAEALRAAGYTVSEAPHGAGALESLVRGGCVPDVLVTDMIMPGMSGAELAATATERFPELRVIVMSGYSDEAPFPSDNDTASWRFLQKPFSARRLTQEVDDLLRPRTMT